MTHKDIYTKFMIEYDKANVTSSYPSLTEYEVATLLDKAYLALIAQKLTGNNQRRMPFEGDNKAIADIEPLIAHADPTLFDNKHVPAINIAQFKLPSDYLYFLQAFLNYKINRNGDRLEESEVYNPVEGEYENQDPDIWVQHVDVYYGQNPFNSSTGSSTTVNTVTSGHPYDKFITRLLPTKLVTHEIAEKFMCTPYNMPWVKNPVCYIEDGVVYAVYDPINKPVVEEGATAHLTYIKKPRSFVSNLVMTEENSPVNPDPTNPTTNITPVDPNSGGESNNLGNSEATIKSYIFTFGNPESLTPSIARSQEEGGGVSVQNTTFVGDGNIVSLVFDNQNVSPKSDARIVTSNAANNKVPYLTFERGEKLIISVTGGILKKVRIPGGDIIGGLIYDNTYPQLNIGTFALASDNQYNQWENSGDWDVTKLVLTNNAPVPPAISSIEVFYTAQETTTQLEPDVLEPDVPNQEDDSSVLYDFLLINSIYPLFDRSVSTASELHNSKFALVSDTVDIYPTNKLIELRDYDDNTVMFTAIFNSVDPSLYSNDRPKVRSAIATINGDIIGNIRTGRRYVWVIPQGTFGDYNFANNTSGEKHANMYMYHFVDLN